MEEKIKTICLILITISIVAFAIGYAFRTLIDVGCSSPKLYSVEKTGTTLEQLGSVEFLGVKCFLWNRQFQLQQNY